MSLVVHCCCHVLVKCVHFRDVDWRSTSEDESGKCFQGLSKTGAQLRDDFLSEEREKSFHFYIRHQTLLIFFPVSMSYC